MVKSNINDWIVCQPINGSIVAEKDGSISCQNIKNVTAACSGVVPIEIWWHWSGPVLETVRKGPRSYSLFYLFCGKTDWYWPVHDPCGRGDPNHKKGVSNPGGQIYLR